MHTPTPQTTTTTPHWVAEAAQAARQAARSELQVEQFAQFTDQLQAARYRLANGLRIVVMPDHRAPVFAYQTWFGVGSKHEEPERTGLAHLFEHLMFKGTARFPAGTFDREIELRGGQTNAATWVDWTYYHQALAMRGENLKTVVEFEVDRLENLVVTESSFRTELEVVQNERRMHVDDATMATLHEQLYALAFSAHPYRWPTIGWMEDLERVGLSDALKFHREHYAVNNAVVVLVGDFDPADALSVVASRYAAIPPRPVRPYHPGVEPVQQEPRSRVLSQPVTTPYLTLGFPIPEEDHPDRAALELLQEILGRGETARLYQALVVEHELAVHVDASVPPFVENALFEISAIGREGVTESALLEATTTVLDRLAEGIEADELEKAKNAVLVDGLEGFRDAEAAAEALGHCETNHGDFSRAFDLRHRWAEIPAERLALVARDTFQATRQNVVIARPSLP